MDNICLTSCLLMYSQNNTFLFCITKKTSQSHSRLSCSGSRLRPTKNWLWLWSHLKNGDSGSATLIFVLYIETLIQGTQLHSISSDHSEKPACHEKHILNSVLFLAGGHAPGHVTRTRSRDRSQQQTDRQNDPSHRCLPARSLYPTRYMGSGFLL